MYDLAIIGGGPAGSRLAQLLASKGYSVFLAEKRKAPGVPIRCGEGVGKRGLHRVGVSPPSEAIASRVIGARLFGPNDEGLMLRSETTNGYILERRVFDKWMLDKAAAEGAEVMAGTEVIDLNPSTGIFKVRGVYGSQELQARTFVSAEGMEARIARKLGVVGPISLIDVDKCYEVEVIDGSFEPFVDFYFGWKRAPRGYVWVFPKGEDRANIGIGVGGHLDADPKRLLLDFLKEKYPEVSIMEEKGGVISVGGLKYPLHRENFAVIGTAARQVDPLHGGGIVMAMEAAGLLSQVFEESLEKGEFSDYTALWRKGPGEKYRLRLKLRAVMESLSDEDLSYVFERMQGEWMEALLRGDLSFIPDLLAGRPQLLASVLALLKG